MSIEKVEAILRLVPNADFTMVGDSIDIWNSAETQPTDAEIQAEITAKQYQRDREYPSIQDQLDMQYWDAVNGTTTWKDAIAQVKADNPKPE